MPPDASSRPEIGFNFTEASTSEKGPGGATMTLKALPVLRWTSTLRPLGALSISSTVHVPATVVHPVTSPDSQSKRRSEEHTSELQSRLHLVCRLLLEK